MRARSRPRRALIDVVCLWLVIGVGVAQGQSANLLSLDFYGPASSGFANGLVAGGPAGFYGVDVEGVVFSLSSQGLITPVYALSNGNPVSPLVLANDGNLYGTTAPDAASGQTTAFRVTPTGTLTVLYSTNAQEPDPNPPCNPAFLGGAEPWPEVMVPLIQGSDGNLYGTSGSSGTCTGTVFKLTLGGALTVLYKFSGPDGAAPWAALLQASDGNFYGTTSSGGANNLGTVFKITPAGVLTTLHSFAGTGGAGGATAAIDGATPMAALVQGADGNLYGTTVAGGASNAGAIFSITPAGALSLLYSFSGQPPDGAYPLGMVLGSDGNFYGTTTGGRTWQGGLAICPTPASCSGSSSLGTIFMITPGGTFSTLYQFGGPDGQSPLAPLVLGADGNFYGVTSAGGSSNQGTVFKVSTGLESAVNAVLPPPTDVTYSIDASGNASVSWAAVTGAAKYNVYSGQAQSGQGQKGQAQSCAGMSDTPAATTTTTSVSLPGASQGVSCFEVAWVNDSGTSGLSAAATESTASPPGSSMADPPAHGGGGAFDRWMLAALGGALLIAVRRRNAGTARRSI